MRKKSRCFIREKKTYCGEYLEVDIYPCTEGKRKRGKRKKKTRKAQENLNEKNAKRAFTQKANTNFGQDDLCVDLTYSDKFLPPTLKEAMLDLKNYIKRLQYAAKKKGRKLKYMAVTEYSFPEPGEADPEPVRCHHHLIINGCLDRDFVEQLWRRKVDGKAEAIGYANARRLQPRSDENGIEARCNYMQKRKKGHKRYTCSQGLKKPVIRKNDSKYSFRKLRILSQTPEDKSYWRQQYPGYEPTRIEWEYNDYTGWSAYIKLRLVT